MASGLYELNPPALTEGLIEMNIPDKFKNPLQRCHLTDKGCQWLAQHSN